MLLSQSERDPEGPSLQLWSCRGNVPFRFGSLFLLSSGTRALKWSLSPTKILPRAPWQIWTKIIEPLNWVHVGVGPDESH